MQGIYNICKTAYTVACNKALGAGAGGINHLTNIVIGVGGIASAILMYESAASKSLMSFNVCNCTVDLPAKTALYFKLFPEECTVFVENPNRKELIARSEDYHNAKTFTLCPSFLSLFPDELCLRHPDPTVSPPPDYEHYISSDECKFSPRQAQELFKQKFALLAVVASTGVSCILLNLLVKKLKHLQNTRFKI